MTPERRPVAGVDYPTTFQEFDKWFTTEDAVRQFLFKLRWSNGFRCPPYGQSGKSWTTNRGLLHCRHCQGQTSVTAGTVFEGTRKPLRTGFLAMWFVTSQKHGISVLGLQRVLGLGSYQTAWAWLHKLRRAMVRPGKERPGTGKSHLVQAIGYQAIKMGFTVTYRSIFDVVRDFLQDQAFAGQDKIMGKYLKSDLLIIDDMGIKQL